MANKALLVTSTTPSREEAEKIASSLVKGQLAACVNIIGPVTSVYSWQGEIQKDEEYKLFIKTTSAKWQELLKTVSEIHSYDTPELTAIETDAMHPGYQKWLEDYVS